MTPRSHHTGLTVLAVFKVVKGLLLLLLGLGLLELMHAEIAALFSLLIEGHSFECRLSPYSRAGSQGGCAATA